MLELKDAGKRIELYNSIEELPIKRYVAYQKYILLDTCVGSTLEDVLAHFEKLDYFLQHNKVNEAKQERLNLHTGIYLQYEKINTTMLSFCCFVKSIDGQERKDLTEEGLQATSEILQETNITIGKLSKLLAQVKKK